MTGEFTALGAQVTSAGTIVFLWRYLETRFPALAALPSGLKRALLWSAGALGALGVHTAVSGSMTSGWQVVFAIPSLSDLLHAAYHLLSAVVYQEGWHNATKPNGKGA